MTLLDIAKNGLNKTSEPKIVVIVGARISGLTAAKLLKDAGHQVYILEASDRVGDRIKTYREKDWYVDLGPMRLPKAQNFEEITGGFDQLPNAFLQEMPGIIYFNSTVKKIFRSHRKVRVFFRKLDNKALSVLTADYVLVTATAKATRLIKFQPPLSHLKAHALRSFRYTSATKVALACTDRFWEKEGIHGGRSFTDHPSRLMYYPNHNFTSGLGILLISYTVHDDADFFVPLSEEKCIDVVLDDLSEVHNVSKDHLKSVCKKHKIQKWVLAKFSMGPFASPTPYQIGQFFKVLFQNEGRVYFAGEHTAHPHGWIETAMKSAIRAASSIHLRATKPAL